MTDIKLPDTIPAAFPGTHLQIITEMKRLIAEMNASPNEALRIRALKQMLDYMVPRLDWVLYFPKFSKIVFDKIQELSRYDPKAAQGYKESIFGSAELEDL